VTLREGGGSVGLRGDSILEGKEGKKDFSWKADLGRMGFTVPIEELYQGEVVGQKWLVGGGRPGFLGAKVFFLAEGSPEKVAEIILGFDPTNGKDFAWTEGGAVKIFQSFRRPPGEAVWSRLREALGKGPFDILLSAADQKVGKYHLQPEQMGMIRADKVDGWVRILQDIVQAYHRGGWKENGKVPSGPESAVDFDEELREVLAENGPVRDEFRKVLTAVAMGGGNSKEKILVNDYWQLMEVNKSPAVGLGCGVARAGVGGRWEVADMGYWVSSGYFGSISLYGIWPYAEGKSLVCRVDVVETDPRQLDQATARMVGEGMFMREVKGACEEIAKRIKGG